MVPDLEEEQVVVPAWEEVQVVEFMVVVVLEGELEEAKVLVEELEVMVLDWEEVLEVVRVVVLEAE